MITVILLLSVMLQFIAAGMAVRLIRLTGERIGWGLLSAAIAIMAVRRCITMVRLIDGDALYHPDVAAEVLALGISFLMVGAMARIDPVFQALRREIGSLELRDTELRASEMRNSMLLSGIHAAVVVHSPDTRIVTSNPMARELLGLTEDQMIGKTVTDSAWAFLREDGSLLPVEEYPVNRVLVSSVPLRDEVVGIRRSGGNVIWALVNADPVPDDKGGIAEVIVTFIEITERKRTEEDLRRSEESVRIREHLLNESQRVGQVGGWDWDAVHDVIWWSDEYYRIYGIDPGSPPPNYTEHLKAYTPESAARLDAAVKRAIETGESYGLDLELAKPTNATHWIVARGEVKRDENGKIWGLRGTAQNITERKQSEAELRALAQRLSLHVSQTPLGVIEWNLNFEVTAWNPAAESIFGFGRSEALGKHASMIVPRQTKEHVDRIWGALISQKGGKRSTNENVTKDGRIIYCEWYNTPLVDESGSVIGVASLVEDVTERRKAEEKVRQLTDDLEQRVRERTADIRKTGDELRESQMALMNIVEDLNEKTGELEQANVKLQELDRLKSLFIASMSHELRTPLNSIIGFSSIMLNEWTGPLTAEQKENLDVILRSGKHLLALINDVIDVSKIEAGKLETNIEAFDVFDVAQEAATAFKPEIDKKGLVLQVRAIHHQMCADRRRLLQCLLNLVSNAVKFTDRGTVDINVALSDNGRSLEFSVCDTGIGLRSEEMQKLFLPFVRIISPMRQVVPGTGLGLYLTRKLTKEVLNGVIIVESEYGVGSRFVIHVPASVEPEAV